MKQSQPLVELSGAASVQIPTLVLQVSVEEKSQFALCYCHVYEFFLLCCQINGYHLWDILTSEAKNFSILREIQFDSNGKIFW